MSDNANSQQNTQPQQRPATIATSTIQTPKSDDPAMSRADKLAKEVQDKQFNAAQRLQMGLGENNALIAVYQTAESNLTPEQKKKKEEEALKRALKTSSKLIKRMAELDAQIAELQEHIDRLRDEAKILQNHIDALQDALDNQDFGLDEDGQLKNKAAERAVAAYEKRNGRKLDRNDIDAITHVLLFTQEQTRQELSLKNAEIEEKTRERDQLQQQRTNLEQDADATLQKATPQQQNSLIQENAALANTQAANITDQEKKTEIDRAQGFNDPDDLDLLSNTDDFFAENSNLDDDLVTGSFIKTDKTPTADFNLAASGTTLEPAIPEPPQHHAPQDRPLPETMTYNTLG